ncbi:MAG TPA: hypothetical protein VMT30_06495 [Candidatus Saccharimonadia bacterium]|nr:hypothetical protein [Candidatus Saccharimonadia bacterium]
MKSLYRLYRLTRYIDNESHRIDKKFPDELRNNNIRRRPKKNDILKGYSRKHKRLSYEKIADLFEQAENEGYIEVNSYDLVRVGIPRGTDFLDFFIIPWGLLNPMLDKYGKLASLIIGLVGGVVVTIATTLAIWTAKSLLSLVQYLIRHL